MKIIVVAAARPNFMKIAPIMKALEQPERKGSASVLLVHTGQHYDAALSDTFFEQLQIREPDRNLGVGSGSHAEQTAKVMMAFETVCLDFRPDWVVVVGDVSSTLACALTAKKLNINVAHVEAGLRSFDRAMPEEINRICTDAISDVLFTTEPAAAENLAREGVPSEAVRFVGNTMIDTLITNLDRAVATSLPDGLQPGEYGVLTLHRPSNVDRRDTLKPLFEAIARIARRLPIVFPVHPRTRKNLESYGLLEEIDGAKRVRLIEPLSYLSFIGLVARSRIVLTDSGGIQEETTYLKVPCLTMRTSTERPITCTTGTNILVGTNPEEIVRHATLVLDGQTRPAEIPAMWDGHAAERIADVLLRAPLSR